MDANLYQQLAKDFITDGTTLEILYTGLGSEAGEVLDNRQKQLINGTTDVSINALKKELGDVLWYVAAISSIMGWSLNEIMDVSIEKLEDRKLNGKSN